MGSLKPFKMVQAYLRSILNNKACGKIRRYAHQTGKAEESHEALSACRWAWQGHIPADSTEPHARAGRSDTRSVSGLALMRRSTGRLIRGITPSRLRKKECPCAHSDRTGVRACLLSKGVCPRSLSPGVCSHLLNATVHARSHNTTCLCSLVLHGTLRLCVLTCMLGVQWSIHCARTGHGWGLSTALRAC